MSSAEAVDPGTERASRWWYVALALALLTFGIAARIANFSTGRALWFDEAALCINLLERGWLGLLEPLEFKQVAPPLYLWSMKLATTVLGATVYAVRVPSIVAGIAGLVIFGLVARRILSAPGALIAFCMAAVSQHFIYYAGEAKPYACDVALGLLVVWIALRWTDKPPTWPRALRYGLALAVVVWYSLPAVFIIAGVGMTQLGVSLWQRDARGLGCLALLYGLSAVSFLVEYIVFIVPSRANEETMAYMNFYWRHGFMPFPPQNSWDLRWFRERAFMFFDMPGGFTLQGLALFVWLGGVMALVAHRVRYAAYLLVPLALTLLASGLKVYPFHGRMTLFLAPVIFLAMGEGLAALGRGPSGRVRQCTVAVALVLLLAQPVVRATRMVVSPTRHHELGVVLAHADAHWQSGDRLYLRQGDYISYRFLAHRYDFPEHAVLVESRKPGTEHDEEDFEAEISPRFSEWGRVWFPMAYDYDSTVAPYIALLDGHGVRFDRFVASGAAVYGLDFGAGEQRGGAESSSN